ncbi:MAG: hypothetical protein J1D88_02955 [Treponema sp.]|nr:hypothetical protein [Treponema sp.]
MGKEKNHVDREPDVTFHKRLPVRLNLLLAVGLVLVLAGIFLTAGIFAATDTVFSLRPMVLLAAAAVLLYVAFALRQNRAIVFFGLSFLFCGLVALVTDASIVPLSFKDLWPLVVIGCGVALFLSGLYRVRHVRSVALFPSIALVLLGVGFLMFSLHVIKVPLSRFVFRWWPVGLLVGGLVLVVIFFVQQHASEKFPYMPDDSLVDETVQYVDFFGDEN